MSRRKSRSSSSRESRSLRHSVRRPRLDLFEALEARRLLAPLFPTWVDGTFTLGDPMAPTPYALADTFKLSSNPTATKTIYMDFDGHHSVANSWNHDIVFPAYNTEGDPSSFTDAELIEIQHIFQNVAEDYLPFNVNVTTTDPGLAALTKSGPGDTTWGVRSVHTQATNGFGNGIGGVAFLNSFDDAIDNPCFSFNKGTNNGAMTQSHEIGHTLGLRHDGLNAQTYHPGVGTGPTSWGPLMGAPFGENLTQWSKGEYTGATNTEDDLVIITSTQNGFGYRADDVGNTIANADFINETTPTSAFDWGFIGTPADVDFYRFDVGEGAFSISVLPFQGRPNLDILANLYNADGDIVASSNPLDDVNAAFTFPTIAAGTYYLSIEGTDNSPVYTDYGTMGFYTVEATYEDQVIEPVVVGESGTVSVNDVWKTVSLSRAYANPVVIAGPATRNGGDPLTVRVRNVTGSSFEIALDEWDYLDGRHSFETVGYFVAEAGRHVLPDGTVIEAGSATLDNRVALVNFSGVFDEIPVLFGQVASVNDPAAVTTRIKNITNSGFQIRLQEEQAAVPQHSGESVGWLAISTGMGNQNGLDFEAFNTGVVVSHRDYNINYQSSFGDTPVFLANMQTTIGGDPATVRLRTINNVRATVFLEEERSFDEETAHNPEQVGYIAMERGLLFYVPGPGLAARGPDAGAPDWFTRVPDDHGSLLAALARIEARGEDSLPLSDDGHGGTCTCPGCLSDVAAGSETDSMVAAVLFGRSTEPRRQVEAEAVLRAPNGPFLTVNSMALAGTTNLTSETLDVSTDTTRNDVPAAGKPEAMAWEVDQDRLKNRRRKA